MKTVLAPVDFSAATEAVLKAASALARAVHGRVMLVHVTQPPAAQTEYAPLLQDIAEITTTADRRAAKQLAVFEADLSSEFVPADSVHLVGSPIPHIVAQAEKHSADYIVMGSHGHSAFYDLLVGSTTHGVIQKAKCPVVIIPAKVLAATTNRQKEQPAATV